METIVHGYLKKSQNDGTKKENLWLQQTPLDLRIIIEDEGKTATRGLKEITCIKVKGFCGTKLGINELNK